MESILANILDKEVVAQCFRSGIGELALAVGRSVGEVESELATMLTNSPRALQLWKNPQNTPDTIKDDQLLGFMWLMINRTGKDLAWLTTFIQATDMVFYEPPSRNLVRAHLQKALLEGKPLTQAEIENTLDALFKHIEENKRIKRISDEWCTAMPVHLEAIAEMGNILYLMYFDEEIKLNEYYVYHKGVYIEPNFLKLESFDFERRQWKFVINANWVANHKRWDKATDWKLDYKAM